MQKTKTIKQVSPLSTMTMLLRHDRTEAEELFAVQFILFLKRIGYSGEIHCRCFLVNQFGQVRRPDFYLPRYGLAIDVDGLTRHSWERRQNDISKRDKFYEDLGAQPLLVLDSSWVVSPFKMDRFKQEFLALLFKNRLSPKRRILINKRLSEGRKFSEERRPEIFQSHGGLAPQFVSELTDAGFKEFRHFGGTRFTLRSKYKTKAIKKLERFKNFLKQQFGKIDPTTETNICDFTLRLLAKKLDHNDRVNLIADFARREQLDLPKLANAIAKIRALYS